MLRLRLRSALIWLAGLALVVCPITGSAQTPNLVLLRVASAADDDVTPLLWADKAGLFRQAGIEIALQRSNNGAAVAAAVTGGAVEIGKSSLLSIVLAHVRGLPLTMIAPGGLHTPASEDSGILVLRDSNIRTASDLNGKIVSVAALNDFQWLAMHAWIDLHGGNSKSVSFIEQPGTSVGAAIDSGRIAAGLVINPALKQDKDTGKYRDLGEQVDAVARRLMFSSWFASADYVAKNPDVIRKFGEVMSRASAYAGSHHDETVALLSSFTGIEPATIRAMPRANYAPALDPALVQPLIDVAAKYGSIPATFDARDLFSPYAFKGAR
jgi:NitT/TauT family transport system substrate-binding protein